MNKRPIDIALELFHEGIQECKDEKQVSEYVQMLCALSVKVMNGLHGKEFKTDFLNAAIEENGSIELVKPN